MDEKTINALCEKFHTTIDNLIPKYASYMMTKDLVTIGISVVLIIISAITLYLILRKYKKLDTYLIDGPFINILIVMTALVVILCSIVTIFIAIYDYALWYNCPDLRFLDTVMNGGK